MVKSVSGMMKKSFMKLVMVSVMLGMLLTPYMYLTQTVAEANTGLTIHFKKPASWGTPQLYYYSASPATVPAVTWSTSPVMTSEGNGWFVYTIPGATSATIIFRDANNQIPAQNQPGFLRTQESWYDGTTWHLSNPDIDGVAPTVPTNLASSNVTQTGLTLTWTASTDNVGVTGYEVWQNNSKLADVTATTYNVTGLTAGTAYTFKVRARDAAGNFSTATADLSVTTLAPSSSDTEAPTVPTNLVSSNVTQVGLTLSWTASTDNVGVTGYEVWQNNSKLADVALTTYNVTGLTAATAYTFKVRARDEVGNFSDATADLSVTTPVSSTPPSTVAYTHTITLDGTNDFYESKEGFKNETFTTSSTGQFSYITWDSTNIYFGYNSGDIASTTQNPSSKWIQVFVGGQGGTRTGLNYTGQQPTLPFDAKYHLRFKVDGSYTNLQIWNGNSWTESKTYTQQGTYSRNSANKYIEFKLPRADLGLTNAKTMQWVSSLLYEATQANSGAVWASVPSDSFGPAKGGFDLNFATYYEFDLASSSASAAQVYTYEFKGTGSTATTADFSFKASIDAASVVIQQSTDEGLTWTDSTLETSLTATSTSAKVTGLNADTNYKFRLVVQGGTNAGSSIIENVKTSAGSSPPIGGGSAYSHTITMDGINDFFDSNNGSKNETFSTSSTGQFSYVTWDAANIYFGYNSKDIASTTENAASKWIWVYVGGQGGTKTGVNYTGQQPTLPFDAKHHFRFRVNATETSLLTWNGTSWTSSKTYTQQTTFNRNSANQYIEFKIPRADLGLTDAKSMQWVSSLVFEATQVNSGAVWASVPSDSFGTAKGGFDLNFETFYEFDLASATGPAAQVYNYGFDSTGSTSATASFSFKASSGATSVAIQQSADGGATWTTSTLETPLTAASTSAKVTGLSGGVIYKFRLNVQGGTNEGSSVIVNLATTPDTIAPTVPTNVTAANITSTGLQLSWTASTDADTGVKEYLVYQGATLLGKSATTNFTVTGLTEATAYTFTVKAVDQSDNESVASAPVTAITLDGTAPSIPGGLNTVTVTATSVVLAWTASTDNVGVTGYEVWRDNVKVADSTGTGFTVTGLTAATKYMFKVRARDLAGNFSDATPDLEVTTAVTSPTDTTPPTVPTNLSTSNVTATGLTLTWGESTDNVVVVGYEVWKNNEKLADTPSTSFAVTGLTAGTKYTFMVRAKDEAGNFSSTTPEVEVTTATPDTQAPTVPGNLTATAITQTGVTLNWATSTDNVAVAGYEVWRDGSKLADTVANSFVVTGLNASTKYVFVVRARDAAGNFSGTTADLEVITKFAVYSKTITIDGTNDFTGQANRTGNETFSTSVATTNFGYLAWDNTNIYFGYRSPDVVQTVENAANKWLWVYVGGQGGTTTGVNYSGQQPKLPFEAKYHIRYKVDGTYMNRMMWDGTAWKDAGSYTLTGRVGRSTANQFVEIRVSRADLGLTNAQTLQWVSTLAYEDATANTDSMWASVPSDAFANNNGFDRDFSKFYEFDFNSGNAPAAQVYMYNFRSTAATSTGATFEFDASTGATSVQIHQSTDGGATWSLATTEQPLTATSTTAKVTGLSPGSNYKFKLVVAGGSNAGSSTIANVSIEADKNAPTAPTNLEAANVTVTGLVLTWSPSTDTDTGVKEYSVFQGPVLLGKTDKSTFTVTGLAEGTNYTFTVKAIDQNGNESEVSNSLNVSTPDQTAPSVVTNLVAGDITQTSLKLSWDASTDNVGVVGYEVWQEGGKIADVSGTTFEVTGLDPGKTYVFKVRATDAANNFSTVSDELEVTTANVPPPDVEAPTVPTNLQATSITQNSINLSWTASTDNVGVVGYEVWINNQKVADTAATTYTATELNAAQKYTFKVRAKDAANNFSEPSGEMEAITTDATAPSQPTQLQAGSVTQNSLVLTWKASTDNVGVTGYEVWRNNTKIADVSGSKFNATGLIQGTRYIFNVRARDAAGNFSAVSSPLQVTTLAPPATPTNVVFTASTSRLSWTAPAGATGYKIYVNQVLTATVGSVTSFALNTSAWVKGRAYSVQILASNSVGDGKLSTAIQATIPRDVILVIGKQISINNKPLPATVQTVNIGGRTFVPFRAIFEPFGVTAAWNAQTRTINASKQGFSMRLQMGSRLATVNNQTVLMDAAPQIIGGVTYVPLRFVGESMGAIVQFRSN